MFLLELLSGTGSVGKVFRAAGWEVVSVDIDPRFGSTIVGGVCELDLADVVARLPPDASGGSGQSKLIWASPICLHYSCARSHALKERDLDGPDRLVRRVLDIAAELGCP